MKKKQCLRIQALVLVLLITLATLVIFPQQVLADTTIAGDEEFAPAVKNEELMATASSPEEPHESEQLATRTESSEEQQKDLGQVATETEINDISSESGNMAGEETDVILADEADIIISDETDILPADESSEQTVEPAVETENNPESLSEQTPDPVNEMEPSNEMDSSNGMESLNKMEPSNELEPSNKTDLSNEMKPSNEMESSDKTDLSSADHEVIETQNIVSDTIGQPPTESTSGNDSQSPELDPDKSNETVINTESSPKLPETNEIKETNETKEIKETNEIKETKETKEDVVTDKPDNQDADAVVPDSAKRENSPRNTTPEDQFVFDPNTGTITDYLGNAREVNIPSTINEVTVTKIGINAFYSNQLTSVEIPDSVTSIGNNAFYSNQLTGVEIPNSVTTIGDYTFSNNILINVEIPNSVTSIGRNAFYSNQLTDVEIPNSVTTIGEGSFKNNPIENKVIPDSITKITRYNSSEILNPSEEQIDYYCFDQEFGFDEVTGTITNYYGTSKDVVIPSSIIGIPVTNIGNAFSRKHLTSVIIPDSVTSIGRFAFAYNQLTSISIPDSVTTIEGSAFLHNRLTEVTIPDSVTNIGEESFKENPIINKVIPDSINKIIRYGSLEDGTPKPAILNPSIEQIDYYCFDQDFRFFEPTGTIYDYTGSSKDIVIPSVINGIPVKHIGKNAFYNKQLTSVEIPDSVITIGERGFSNNQLTDIIIPNSVTTIEDIAFTYNQLTDVTISDSVTTIGNSAFSYNKLTGVEIPNSVITIGSSAFYHNELTSVEIPDSVTTIGYSAFYVNQLTSVEIPDSVTTIGQDAFADNQLTSVTISNSLTRIEDGLFSSNQLTDVIIPDSVTSIGERAFYKNKLTSVRISNSATTIGNQAFYWNQLTDVTIPDSVTTIGERAFSGNQLTSVRISNSLTSIEYATFEYNKLTDIDIPDSVTTIGDSAFIGNELTSVTIPDYVISIGDRAFSWNQLTSITIPDSVTTIGNEAFFWNKLTDVTIPDSVTTIGEASFKENPIENKVIPDSITKITRYGYLEDGTPKPDVLDPSKEQIDYYCFDQEFRFDEATGTITRYSGKSKDVVIPAMINEIPVRNIGDYVFYSKQLTSVIIPDSVTTIGGYAFASNQLTDVTIPNSVTTIASFAFLGNQILNTTLSDSLSIIGAYAFAYNQLSGITIPDSVITIGDYAFATNQLTGVSIPNSITRIGNYSFDNNQLTDVILPDSVEEIGAGSFTFNSISRVRIPNNIKRLFFYNYNSGGEPQPPIENPTIDQVVEYCFDSGISSVEVNYYIKAGSDILSTPGGEITETLKMPIHVTGTIEGNCFKFSYKGETAYTDLNAITNCPPPITGYTVNSVDVRNAPDGDVIGSLSIGQKVSGTLEIDWVEFTYSDGIGYVDASLLQADPVESTRYVVAGSNIRSAPGGSIIETLKMPIYVSGIIEGNYLKFTYKEQTAYAHLGVTTTNQPAITGYTKSTVNVRNAPDGDVIGSLPIGYKVNGMLEVNWVKFNYSGETGYIYAPLLQADPVQSTRYVVAGANIRSAPGESIIETLKMPIYVSGIIEGNYLEFTYKEQTAYAHLGVTTTNQPAITGYTKGSVNVRNAPDGDVIGSLSIGQKVNGTLEIDWVKFNYSGNTGYLYAPLLQADPVEVTRYVLAGSNLRNKPGGTIIETLSMPICVTGIIEGNYLKFIYKNQTAYAHMSVVTMTSPPITGYTESTVNVRSAPNGNVIGSLAANQKVTGTLAGNWVKFTYSGTTGYIYAPLLR